MVIATTGDSELLDSALCRLGIRQYFSQIFDCAALHTSKRQPDIYIRAAAYIQQQPEHIYVFEDALYALMTAAAPTADAASRNGNMPRNANANTRMIAASSFSRVR